MMQQEIQLLQSVTGWMMVAVATAFFAFMMYHGSLNQDAKAE